MSRNQKLLWSLLTVVVMGSLAAFGTFSAFSHSTSNPGNNFDIGTVNITDNDANSALYEIEDAGPGTSEVSCIEVTYGGSIDSDVKLYVEDDIGDVAGDLIELTVEKGTVAGPFNADCTGFAPATTDNPELYNGSLNAFQNTHNEWSNGLAHYPDGQTAWEEGNKVVYRITVDFPEPGSVDNTANRGNDGNPFTLGDPGYTTGEHAYTWEARNQ
jgi:hypothetical protein